MEQTASSTPRIVSRAEQPDDEKFLFVLYASTRKDELDSWEWPPEMRKQFLELQFRAQQSYRSVFPNARFEMLLSDGQRIGRTVIDRSVSEIRLVDIALLPEFRNRGIGAAVIRNLRDEAAVEKKPLRLTILKGNRCASLYQRLGFVIIGETATHTQMEWRG